MKVIIDCDPGNGVPGANVDDGLALALAAAAEQIEIVAVTIVAGNTPNRVGYAAAQTLLEDLDVDVPIFLGADRPLVEDPKTWRSHLDRAVSDPTVDTAWAGTPRPRDAHDVPDVPAANAIGELVRANPGEIVILAIGPLTNIALALRLHPDLARQVGRIIIMGAVFDVDGYLVDTNFGFDPEAAAIVMSSGANITLVPMDVTTRTLLTPQDLEHISRVDSALTRALVPGLRPWVGYSARTRRIDGMWVHDVVTVAVLLDPSLIASRTCSVIVELAPGLTRGRSACWTPGALQKQGSQLVVEPPPIEVVEDIDNRRLIDLIVATFEAQV